MRAESGVGKAHSRSWKGQKKKMKVSAGRRKRRDGLETLLSLTKSDMQRSCVTLRLSGRNVMGLFKKEKKILPHSDTFAARRFHGRKKKG